MGLAAETLDQTSWTAEASGSAGAGGRAAARPADDAGLQALAEAARRLDVPCDAGQIWHAHGRAEGRFDEWDIQRAARRLGLRARTAPLRAARLRFAPVPAMLELPGEGEGEGESGGWRLLTAVDEAGAEVLDPLTGAVERLAPEAAARRFAPRMIFLTRDETASGPAPAFGLRWFLPSILKHGPRLRRVVAASLVIQAFALAAPKLSEVVIDRVLVSRGLQSLDALAVGLLLIAVFEPLMSGFRALIYAHVASGVNAELSSRLFRHLVNLPLGWFAARRTGAIVARVRELDQIRTFLTGSALMMVLDLAFVGVFVAIMFSYAAQLAWLVIGSLAVYLAIWTAVAPALRARVEGEYERAADGAAFLTETVTGIETVKTLAVGDRFRRDWESRLAAQLKAGFRVSVLGMWAGGAIGLAQKLLAAALLWFGVRLVIDGQLSVGQLVAFNMLSGHVTMPILRLAQVWQDFQHVGVSIRRLGDILDAPAETASGAGRSSLDRVRGEVELRKVTFRYSDDGAEVLRRLDLRAAPGETLGVTGLSGSGKSTITKLVQRLYRPQGGQVLVDGVDLAMADVAMLRRRMGVVLQESFLFNGSVRENIALGDPQADAGAIERAARLAGAHDFIAALPQGYDAQVGERGGALSGGQRQRIAIARALVGDPAILIFDEATSALDYETEAAILEQLPQILAGRTTIMIAHRLNAMRLCDRVVVMEKGEIIEEGPHDALVAAGGRYAELWRLQNA